MESSRIWGGIGQRGQDRQRSQTHLGLGLCRTRGSHAGAPLPLPLGSRATHPETSTAGSGLPLFSGPGPTPTPFRSRFLGTCRAAALAGLLGLSLGRDACRNEPALNPVPGTLPWASCTRLCFSLAHFKDGAETIPTFREENRSQEAPYLTHTLPQGSAASQSERALLTV